MSKLTARLLVIALSLAAAILACQLPGSRIPIPRPTTGAAPVPTATPLATGLPQPPAGTGVPTLPANVQVNTPNPQQAYQTYTADAKNYTQAAMTGVALTAAAKKAAAQASPPSTVLTQGATGALPRMLNLAFNGKGNLHLFDLAQAGTSKAVFHQQRGAGGTWTPPQQVTDSFDVHSLLPLPDPNAGCLLLGGQATTAAVTGVFLSCPNTDGSWPAVTDPIAKPLTSGNVRIVALAAATGTTAGALYLSPVNRVQALFFSPIDLMASHAALAAIRISQDASVVEADLAYDSNGRWHAVWLENSGNDTAIAIQAADSADQGKTWSAPQKLYAGTADNPSSVVMQLVADSRGNVHTAWEGDRKVIYRGWIAASGWGDVVQLSNDNVVGLGERLAVTADGQLRAVWTEVTGNVHSQIVYSAQAADGTWDPPQPVAADRAFDLALSVDVQGANHVVWTGQADMRYATWAP